VARQLRPPEGGVHDALAAVVKAWRDLNREKRVRRTAIVEEGQVDMMLRLGLDVLSCALREPRTDSLQELRARIDHVTSTIAH